MRRRSKNKKSDRNLATVKKGGKMMDHPFAESSSSVEESPLDDAPPPPYESLIFEKEEADQNENPVAC